MIEIPVHSVDGKQVGTLPIDEAVLGGQVRPVLLKQAYVRIHANQRQGTAATKSRKDVEGSTRKLYKQKHTGRARRGTIRTNIMRGGGRAHGKVPHSWRQRMPTKMRRLANRNALLAKAVDGEIRLIDDLATTDKPSTRHFVSLLSNLKIDRSCLLALADTRTSTARSARNIENLSITQINRLNVFDLLNHRYLLASKREFASFYDRLAGAAKKGSGEKEARA